MFIHQDGSGTDSRFSFVRVDHSFYTFYVKVLSARALNRNGIDDTIIQLRLDSSKRMRA